MTSPKEWSLHAIKAWSTSEEFPGHPFPGLQPCIELAIKNAVDEALAKYGFADPAVRGHEQALHPTYGAAYGWSTAGCQGCGRTTACVHLWTGAEGSGGAPGSWVNLCSTCLMKALALMVAAAIGKSESSV